MEWKKQGYLSDVMHLITFLLSGLFCSSHNSTVHKLIVTTKTKSCYYFMADLAISTTKTHQENRV